MKDIVIIGAGGFGREVAWLIEDINKEKLEWNIVGFIDDNESIQGTEINGYPVIGKIDDLKTMDAVFVSLGIGSPKVKEIITNRIKDFENISFVNLIHPSVVIAPYATIGNGNIVCANNILSVNSKIRDFVTVNLNCTVGHDVELQNFVTISPGVNLSGFVTIANATDIGTSSSIIQGVYIGQNSIIGAGSVIIKNIPDNCTAVGSPAKPIKFHE